MSAYAGLVAGTSEKRQPPSPVAWPVAIGAGKASENTTAQATMTNGLFPVKPVRLMVIYVIIPAPPTRPGLFPTIWAKKEVPQLST